MSDVGPSDVNSHEDRRTCWVCFATIEDDRSAKWCKPCRCRGTSKYVHQQCLQRWIDEKQKGNATASVSCPQCNTEYLIDFPKQGPLMYLLDLIERVIVKVCPLLAGGILAGSIYWTLVTYGAVSVMQALGHKEGLQVMESADPLSLLFGLPAIPVMLILCKLVRWEDFLLRLYRKHAMQFFKNYRREGEAERVPGEVLSTPLSEPFSLMRILCGALIMPTSATVCGKILFSNVSSNFQRTLLGGTAFLVIKGIFKLYLMQQQYNRQARRTIRDFEDTVPSPRTASVQHSRPHQA